MTGSVFSKKVNINHFVYYLVFLEIKITLFLRLQTQRPFDSGSMVVRRSFEGASLNNE